jgi:hypothetical protein
MTTFQRSTLSLAMARADASSRPHESVARAAAETNRDV